MLHVTAWKWGQKYGPEYVARLARGIRKHLTQEHRFFVSTPPVEDWQLTQAKGCFARLRMFHPWWQELHGIKPGERLVCIDLDCVVTGPLDPLFNRPDNFCILVGANSSNPCPYNGSLWMLRAGHRPDVWSDFNLQDAQSIPHYEFPDDQGWLALKMPGVPGWKVGAPSGVFAFKKPAWPKDCDDLPSGARMVVFPGWRDPSKFAHLPWVKEHWQ